MPGQAEPICEQAGKLPCEAERSCSVQNGRFRPPRGAIADLKRTDAGSDRSKTEGQTVTVPSPDTIGIWLQPALLLAFAGAHVRDRCDAVGLAPQGCFRQPVGAKPCGTMGVTETAQDPAIVMRRPTHPDFTEDALPRSAMPVGICLKSSFLIVAQSRQSLTPGFAGTRLGPLAFCDHPLELGHARIEARFSVGMMEPQPKRRTVSIGRFNPGLLLEVAYRSCRGVLPSGHEPAARETSATSCRTRIIRYAASNERGPQNANCLSKVRRYRATFWTDSRILPSLFCQHR